ncbi:hypothetical protein GcM3_090020 [Golovinomyces cichoracearum]|uniref:Uncharacterized protein n=1 Tax=Golovinomyces cichoracearum TaxID=62708 RepID=A0A420II42_9PEZI|nr:hypothetical protein GcM3_090020 [Golovinomyces cichoracearum]
MPAKRKHNPAVNYDYASVEAALLALDSPIHTSAKTVAIEYGMNDELFQKLVKDPSIRTKYKANNFPQTSPSAIEKQATYN